MLNLAADDGLLESVPRISLGSERHRARARVLSGEELERLLSKSPRWLQRVEIAAYETAISQGDLLGLDWPQVDEQEGLIRLKGGRGKTGVKQIAPVTPALRSILAELRTEQQRVRSIENRVFTKEGRPIKRSQLRKAFDRAVLDAGTEDFVFHDFRHMAKTKWAEMGIPVEASMLAAGQTSLAMHSRYVNLQEAHLKEAFKMLTTCSHENSEQSCNTVTA